MGDMKDSLRSSAKNWRRFLKMTVLLWTCFLGLPLAKAANAITVYPQNSSWEIGGGTLQCTAYVPLTPNTVQWQVNGVVGGSAATGTISTTGVYTPPASVPVNNVVTITAQSTAFATSSGTTNLTLTRSVPHLWSVSPTKLQAGNYSVTFNGSNFAPDSVAVANGVDVTTTYKSATSLVATGSAQVGAVAFNVRQPGPGAVSGEKVSVTVVATVITVAVAPTAASVNLSATKAFTATVTGSSNTAVTWYVNGIAGGSAATGTISSAGLYTAPTALPSPATVTVKAISVANTASSAQATVTLTTQPPPPVTVAVSPTAASVQLGQTQTFTATVTNSTNTAVTWSVNGTTGGSTALGTISTAGVYTAPAAAPSGAITVKATSVASSTASAQATVTLTAPPPAAVWLTGARFLEQTSFGPTPATLVQIQQMGLDAYLQQQLAMPETPIPAPSDNSMGTLQQWVLYNYTTAQDQLRQRVAYALSQILVTSNQKLVYADEMIPWLQILSHDAFGNYRTLLQDIATCPSMGKYLDLANSTKPGPQGGANENFAREVMQLFTIGEVLLDGYGNPVLDGSGATTVTYTQDTVSQVALALTGWTYTPGPGVTASPTGNFEYFGAPMIPCPANHDLTQKSFLGTTLPQGQGPDVDLKGVLDTLFKHQNVGPFIATRLIRSLVTSNPSPAYIKRVADVFNDNGSQVRGDLKAVVVAILMDAEARQDTPTVNQGRLKEPILQISGLLRALGGAYLSTEQVTYMYDNLAQTPLGPPSVFNWFSPLYRIPQTTLFGPEFQIYTASEATLRGNFFYWLLTTPGGSATLDLSPFQPYGNDMNGLVEAANQALLYGRMDPAMKQVIANAAAPGYDATTRITTVLYLTALSGQYAVQY